MAKAKNEFSNVEVFTIAVVGPAAVAFLFGGAVILGSATTESDHILGLLEMLLGGGAFVGLAMKFADRIN